MPGAEINSFNKGIISDMFFNVYVHREWLSIMVRLSLQKELQKELQKLEELPLS